MADEVLMRGEWKLAIIRCRFTVSAFITTTSDGRAPTIFASVGYRSIACTISSLDLPASILPGQRTAKGTRSAPS